MKSAVCGMTPSMGIMWHTAIFRILFHNNIAEKMILFYEKFTVMWHGDKIYYYFCSNLLKAMI